MRGNDQGTSVLFSQTDKITQAYCIFGLKRDKKNKTIQNRVETKDAGLTPPAYEVAEASTDTSCNLKKKTSFDYYINKRNSCSCDIVPESIEQNNYIQSKVNMQGDTIVENKPPTQSPKQKKNKIKAKKEISFRDHSTETQKKKISKKKHYKQSDPLQNDDVPCDKSKRTYKVTCPNNEKSHPGGDKCYPCLVDAKLVNEKTQAEFEGEKSLKVLKELKHDSKKNKKTLCKCENVLQTNVKLEMKPKDMTLCHGGPCSGSYRCSRALECACNGNKPSVVEDLVKSKAKNVPDGERKQKNKVTCLCHDSKLNKHERIENVFAEGPKQHQNMCKEGVCVEAIKNKDFSFVCKCKTRKQKKKPKEVNECTDNSCNVSNESKITESKATIDKLQKKITCLCRKYSQKIKELGIVGTSVNKEACNKGLCRDALEKHNKNFKCLCKKKTIIECSDDSCSLEKTNAKKITQKNIKKDKNKLKRSDKKQDAGNEDSDLDKTNIRKEETTKSIKERLCRRCRSKNSPASKNIRQPLDTKKVTSVKSKIVSKIKSKSESWSSKHKKTRPKSKRTLETSSGANQCRALIYSQSMQNKGFKFRVNEKPPVCHCKKCKEKKKVVQKQPDKVTKGKNDCGDAVCNKHTRNANTGPCGVCCKCKKKLSKASIMSKCQSFICTSLANLKRKREQKQSKKVIKSTSECGDVLCSKHNSNVKTGPCGVCCKCKKNQNMISKCQSFICSSFENLIRKRKTQKVQSVTKEKKTPLKSSKTQITSSKTKITKAKAKPPPKKKKSVTICTCHHQCQCDLALKQDALKKKKRVKVKSKPKKKKKVPDTNKSEKQKLARQKAIDKRKQRSSSSKKLQESIKGDAKFNRQVRQKEKKEKKKQQKLQKQQIKELERLSEGKEQMQETSCVADFFLGLVKTALKIVKTIAFVIFNLITKPKISCRYIKLRIKDPIGTFERIKKWAFESWQLKKLEMAKTVGGSDTMSILGDTMKETAVFQAFSNKGKTKKERHLIEQENLRRKKRIKKRHDEAVYGCKHTLLTTLRKTPCLWVYHICPGFYPQCLSLLAFWKKFSNMMLFCLAFAVWTPCILACELCRGLMCCTLCMG